MAHKAIAEIHSKAPRGLNAIGGLSDPGGKAPQTSYHHGQYKWVSKQIARWMLLAYKILDGFYSKQAAKQTANNGFISKVIKKNMPAMNECRRILQRANKPGEKESTKDSAYQY